MRKLVFTHAENFREKYGEANLLNLRNRLQLFIRADNERGINTEICYVDEEAPAQSRSARRSPNEIKQIVDRKVNKGLFDYLLIVGGDDIVPFFRYKNPHSDDDHEVLSDNGYAQDPIGEAMLPYFVQRALGRLATGHETKPDILWNQLDEILSFRPAPVDQASGVAISAEYWSTPSWQIADDLKIRSRDFHLSRPIDLDATPTHLDPNKITGHRLHFFNVHGASRTADWYGQSGGDFPRAYEPALIPADVQHSIVGCEACYGADIVGTPIFPRVSANSICLTYLVQQVAGFCGSTTIAYGATNDSPMLNSADLLVKYFLEAVREGKTLGKAILYAKSRLTTEVVHSRGWIDPITHKTLLQFVLYGDPSISVFTPLKGAPKVPHIDALTALAVRGELAKHLFDMLPEARLVEHPSPKGLPKEGISAPKVPPGVTFRLKERKSYELEWPEGRRESAAKALADQAPFLEFDIRPPRRGVIWHLESYEAAKPQEVLSPFFVRIIEEIEGSQNIILEAASR
jgi:hypothetical protein